MSQIVISGSFSAVSSEVPKTTKTLSATAASGGSESLVTLDALSNMLELPEGTIFGVSQVCSSNPTFDVALTGYEV